MGILGKPKKGYIQRFFESLPEEEKEAFYKRCNERPTDKKKATKPSKKQGKNGLR